MNDLNFLLYILAQSISSIKPVLIEALIAWHELYYLRQESNIDIEEFLFCLNLSAEHKQKFLELHSNSSSDKYFEDLQKYKIQTINLFEDNYPTQLKQIPDRPLLLYYQGNIEILNKNSLAIVGSRAATTYGKNVVEKIISGLSNYEFNIISGLAFGIDTTAHIQALKNNLSTTAILGSGLDENNIYPKTNFRVAQNILEHGGLLISEYPPGSSAFKHQFIARNRIIAGLSSLTIIIEAASKSGSLLTADFTLEYNRSVYAVPGSIFSPNSAGCHNLISQGAGIFTSLKNILDEFNIEQQVTIDNSKFTELQLRVLECIQTESKELELIAEQTDIPISELMGIISELELAQKIKLTSSQTYTIF